MLFIIINIIIDNYPVNCSFCATLNLIFVPTRIVMKSLNLGKNAEFCATAQVLQNFAK
jgi:hypothetical protein